MELILTFFITAVYFIIGIAVAVYKTIMNDDERRNDKVSTLIHRIIEGIFWPTVIISYAAKKKKITILILGILFLVGCTDSTPYQDERSSPILEVTSSITGYMVTVKGSDGCDYIHWYDLALDISGMTHSGSCRKCKLERDSIKSEIIQHIDSVLLRLKLH